MKAVFYVLKPKFDGFKANLVLSPQIELPVRKNAQRMNYPERIKKEIVALL